VYAPDARGQGERQAQWEHVGERRRPDGDVVGTGWQDAEHTGLCGSCRKEAGLEQERQPDRNGQCQQSGERTRIGCGEAIENLIARHARAGHPEHQDQRHRPLHGCRSPTEPGQTNFRHAEPAKTQPQIGDDVDAEPDGLSPEHYRGSAIGLAQVAQRDDDRSCRQTESRRDQVFRDTCGKDRIERAVVELRCTEQKEPGHEQPECERQPQTLSEQLAHIASAALAENAGDAR